MSPRCGVFARLRSLILLTLVVPALAQVPDYKLGDVATQDVVTPVQFFVVNPEASSALKQQVAAQVLNVVRYSPQTAAEAEKELQQTITMTRSRFLRALQTALGGRTPAGAELVRAYTAAFEEIHADASPDLPLEQLANRWVRGQSDAAFIESLLQPLREVMAQPVATSSLDAIMPATQSVRLLTVKNLAASPTALELEDPGQVVASGKIISVGRARRTVETQFPAGQEQLGRFAGGFVRPNAILDQALTEILRARKMEGVTVNDTYEAAQVVVRKGELIDRKVLSALAVMREKSLIGALQTKLEQEKVVAGLLSRQAKWIAVALGVICVALLLIWRRLRVRPSSSLVLQGTAMVERWEQNALPGEAGAGSWQQRALLAEGQAERAQAAIRSGVLGWMREKIFRTLSRHRGELLSVQQRAEAEMRELEQRLEQLHTPLQERISSYEKRIEELERDLAQKGEENRQLIGARINAARQQLQETRQRGDEFSTN